MATENVEKNTGKGKIVTFYSFEGGVGTSTMTSRVAGLLANEGQKIALLDFNLNSPGLSLLLNHTAKISTRGFSGFCADTWLIREVPAVELYVDRAPLDQWGMGRRTDSGRIDFMPAYYVPGEDPPTSLRAFRDRSTTQRLFETLTPHDSEAADKLATTASLGNQLRLAYDLTLIDLQSGVNNLSGLAMRQIADLAVVLLRPDKKGIIGTRRILPQLRSIYVNGEESVGSPVPKIIVATQLPAGYTAVELRRSLSLPRESEVFTMPFDPALLIDDDPFLKKIAEHGSNTTMRSYEVISRRLLTLG